MTSSLVGSEMCIRDRINAAGGVEHMSVRRRGRRELRREEKEVVFKEKAVSYTHLTLPTICSV
eukprot:6141722-Prorocentrum_lima.AAC.1